MAKAYKEYTLGDFQRLGVSFLGKNKTEEECAEIMARIEYAIKIGDSIALNLRGCLLEPFIDMTSTLGIKNQTDINLAIFAIKSSGVIPQASSVVPMVEIPAGLADIRAAISFGVSLDNLKQQISNLKDSIENYELEIRTKATKLFMYEKQLGAFDNFMNNASKVTFRECLEKALGNTFWQFAKLEQIYSNQYNLWLHTVPISVTTTGTTVQFGTFLLKVKVNIRDGYFSFDGDTYCKAWQNLCSNSGSALEYPHPHICSTGAMCFGDLKIPAYKALHEGDFAGYLSYAQKVLQSYNPESPYKKWEHYVNASYNHRRNTNTDYWKHLVSKVSVIAPWPFPFAVGDTVRFVKDTGSGAYKFTGDGRVHSIRDNRSVNVTFVYGSCEQTNYYFLDEIVKIEKLGETNEVNNSEGDLF